MGKKVKAEGMLYVATVSVHTLTFKWMDVTAEFPPSVQRGRCFIQLTFTPS